MGYQICAVDEAGKHGRVCECECDGSEELRGRELDNTYRQFHGHKRKKIALTQDEDAAMDFFTNEEAWKMLEKLRKKYKIKYWMRVLHRHMIEELTPRPPAPTLDEE